jgi:hypothetical protein
VLVASEAHAITVAVEGLLGVIFTVATLTDEAVDVGEVILWCFFLFTFLIVYYKKRKKRKKEERSYSLFVQPAWFPQIWVWSCGKI